MNQLKAFGKPTGRGRNLNYVDDINGVIYNREGAKDMIRVEVKAAEIIKEVAEKWALPLEKRSKCWETPGEGKGERRSNQSGWMSYVTNHYPSTGTGSQEWRKHERCWEG